MGNRVVSTSFTQGSRKFRAGHGLVTDQVTKNKFEHTAIVVFSSFMLTSREKQAR